MCHTRWTKGLFLAGSICLVGCGAAPNDGIGRLQQALAGPASLTLNPSTIAGGSGGSSTATVTLGAAAPAGGTVVTLTSSNASLAASVPSFTVPAGSTSATFTVATNSLYRRYSGLAFTVTLSASAGGVTASAILTVSAPPPPADITGDSCQRAGFVCGGSFPASRGDAGILYECFVAPTCNGMNGTCTFRQECLNGCLPATPDGFTFNDACATGGGPFPIALNPSSIISGDRPSGTLFLAAPQATTFFGGAQSNNFTVTAQTSSGVPIPAGATSASLAIATSYSPTTQFASISVGSDRLALAWLTSVPPTPAPAQVIPTLANLQVQGGNPVTGGTQSWEIVFMSGVSPAGGPTVILSSSNPAVASVPPSVTIAAGSTGALVFITTHPVAQNTAVTLSATDGRYTFSDVLTVLAASCTPTTCAAQGKNCGTIADGCGGTLNCGACAAPQTCGGGGVANVCGGGCTPTTCAAQGKNCGTIADGCGGTLNCGACVDPQVCGGGGVPNVCADP